MGLKLDILWKVQFINNLKGERINLFFSLALGADRRRRPRVFFDRNKHILITYCWANIL